MTGFTSSMRPSPPASGSGLAGDGPMPRHAVAENPADAADRERTDSPEQNGWNPFSREGNFAPAAHPPSMSPRQLILRVFLMAAIFVVGITAGLYAARWMTRPATVAPVDAVRQTAPVATVTRDAEPDVRRDALRGISAGELPYDGAPPEGEDAVSRAPAATAAERYSGESAPEDDTAQTDGTPSSEAPAGETHGAAVKEPADAAVPVSRGSAQKQAAPKEPAQKRAERKAASAEKGQGQNAKAAAKDREIERIKKQADHELQRKLQSRAGDKKVTRPKLAAGARDVRRTAAAREIRVKQILARCERNSNLFRREQCKWRVCGDSWGKNGCPSYAKPASIY